MQERFIESLVSAESKEEQYKIWYALHPPCITAGVNPAPVPTNQQTIKPANQQTINSVDRSSRMYVCRYDVASSMNNRFRAHSVSTEMQPVHT